MTATATMPLPGQPAPDLDIDLIIDAKWKLAEQSPDAFALIVFFRGLHCGICGTYLKELRDMYDDLLSKGVEVVAVSMETKERATKAHEDWGLDPLPMGHSLTEAQARAWGLYLSKGRKENEPDLFCEPGLFLVKSDRTLDMAEMSSTPFIRPDLKLLLSKIDFVRDTGYPPRGTHEA